MKHAIYNAYDAQKYTKVIKMGWIPLRISVDGRGGRDYFADPRPPPKIDMGDILAAADQGSQRSPARLMESLPFMEIFTEIQPIVFCYMKSTEDK